MSLPDVVSGLLLSGRSEVRVLSGVPSRKNSHTGLLRLKDKGRHMENHHDVCLFFMPGNQRRGNCG